MDHPLRTNDPAAPSRHFAAEPPHVTARVAAQVVAGCGIVAAFVFCFWGVMTTLWGQWQSSPTHSYGMLVIPTALYLVWLTRDTWWDTASRPAYVTGTAVVIAALAGFRVGVLTGIISLQQIAMFGTFVGLLLLVFGIALVRRWAVPLLYATLAFPIWDVFIARLHWPLQLFSADVAARLLGAAGVPIYREGVLISLPNINLAVEDVCSGVGYLLAVVALGVPLAFLFLTSNVRRLALVLIAVAVAAFSNSVRIALIGLLSHNGYEGAMHGPGHVLTGIFVYGAGYVALGVALSFLRIGEPQPARRSIGQRAISVPPVFAVMAIPVILLLVTAAATIPTASIRPFSIQAGAFPQVIGTFRAVGIEPRAPSEEGEWTRAYVNPQKETVTLTASLMSASVAAATDQLAAQRPVVSQDGSVVVPTGTRSMGGVTEHEAYWFVVDGREFGTMWTARAYQVWRAVLGRQSGAVLVVSATKAPDTLQAFVPGAVVALRGIAGPH